MISVLKKKVHITISSIKMYEYTMKNILINIRNMNIKKNNTLSLLSKWGMFLTYWEINLDRQFRRLLKCKLTTMTNVHPFTNKLRFIGKRRIKRKLREEKGSGLEGLKGRKKSSWKQNRKDKELKKEIEESMRRNRRDSEMNKEDKPGRLRELNA